MSLERVERSLLRLDRSGQFAVQHREPAIGLSIEVEGVGPCPFPLAPDRLAALVASAAPSPFGYRDETRHDPAVRSSWEIPASRLRFDVAWSRRFERGLAQIVEGLGLPSTGEVTPVLQKLVLYEAGQFFARHRDSQTNPGTAATLVVSLPSSHRGGDLRIVHRGETATFSTARDAAANYLSFVGFFADCPHETLPVEAGHRVVLSYALEVEPHALPQTRGGVTDVEQSLRAYFEPEDESDTPDWLVYLLDHQYSEQSIGWARLKHEDRVRASALLEAAERVGCACFLALAETREVREYVGDDEEGETDDDEVVTSEDGAAERCLPSPSPDRNDDPADYVAPFGATYGASPDHGGALVDLELTLTEWVDHAGRRCRGTDRAADSSCIVYTCELDERVALEKTEEPWTGNEGGTSEKWYYQTVLVLVPRDGQLHAEISEADPDEPVSTEPSETAGHPEVTGRVQPKIRRRAQPRG